MPVERETSNGVRYCLATILFINKILFPSTQKESSDGVSFFAHNSKPFFSQHLAQKDLSGGLIIPSA